MRNNESLCDHIVKKKDPIKHVVVLMMENQSFDRKLGAVKKIKPELEGVDPVKPYFNLDNKGKKIYQKATRALQMPLDPLHDEPAVRQQLVDQNGGFVQNFMLHYPNSTAEDRQSVMAYYPTGFLPATHALAAEYTVCDHWFSSVPGPTWPNRFFALSGTSNGRVGMPEKLTDYKNYPQLFYQSQPNIFDRLDERGISWKCYYGDVPISLVLTRNREPDNLMNYRSMDSFFADVKGPADQFPQFSFIEPKYMRREQNDDHPPHNTMKAEKLIADVYNALRANEELWLDTLFVLVYDEHGGFYDHVIPPAAVPPDDHHEEGFYFDKLGLRVPAILISPRAKKSLVHTVFDHTSLLKYLCDKWDLLDLGERTRQANSIEDALDLEGEPRKDCLENVFIPDSRLRSPMPHLEKHTVNDNEKMLHAFADFLNKSNERNAFPDLPPLSKLAKVKNKIGKQLERMGLVKLGDRLREAKFKYDEARVDQTLKIIGNKLTLFQAGDKHDTKGDIKQSTLFKT